MIIFPFRPSAEAFKFTPHSLLLRLTGALHRWDNAGHIIRVFYDLTGLFYDLEDFEETASSVSIEKIVGLPTVPCEHPLSIVRYAHLESRQDTSSL